MSDGKSLPDVVEEIMKSVVQILTPAGQGAGFFVRDDGMIITNKHVVGTSTFVKLKTVDGREYDGQVFRGDTARDHAFLYTNAPMGKVLALGDSDSVRIAETVVAIGHPYGYSFTVSEGIVSAIERHEVIPGLNAVGFLQLDAGINPGNSGGPLIRKTGEVIGMITMTLLHAKGVSFAIPAKILNDSLKIMTPLTREDALARRYCGICGMLNGRESRYCEKCGAALKKAERPAGYYDVQGPPIPPGEPGNGKGAPALCPVCGSSNKSSEKYCLQCGAALAAGPGGPEIRAAAAGISPLPVTCAVCGTAGTAGTYCAKCGAQLKL